MKIESMLKQFGGQRVLVVGDLMLDRYISGPVERISPEAPVPVLKADSETESPGGAGNVALNLKTLGAEVEIVCTVGDDPEGASLKSILKHLGVGVRGIVKDRMKPTAVKTRLVSGNQQIARVDREQISDISRKYEAALVKAADRSVRGFKPAGIIISDYAKGVVTQKVAKAVIKAAYKYSIPVVVDPKGNDYAKYKGANTLTPNRREAEAATGVMITDDASVKKAADVIKEATGARNVLITRGADGISFVGPAGNFSTIPSDAREVYDVTGAGDTVVSAFTLSFVTTGQLREAVIIANAAAGIAVSRAGAASATREELSKRLSLGNNFNAKFFPVRELTQVLSDLRAKGSRIVFTNGCFDLVHAGHLKLLREARSFGDCLVVALNSDSSVKKLKGKKRPYVREKDRCNLISALDCVDYVTVFNEQTPLELIKELNPHVLVKGGDYKPSQVVGKDFVESGGGEVRIVPLLKGLSSSSLAHDIKKSED